MRAENNHEKPHEKLSKEELDKLDQEIIAMMYRISVRGGQDGERGEKSII